MPYRDPESWYSGGVSNASTHPSYHQVNPLNDSLKATRILDIDKLCTAEWFGPELSVSCSEWTEAAKVYCEYQTARDCEGPNR
jgi:hypothetical protein